MNMKGRESPWGAAVPKVSRLTPRDLKNEYEGEESTWGAAVLKVSRLTPETLPHQDVIKNTKGGARGAAVPKGCQTYPWEPPFPKRGVLQS